MRIAPTPVALLTGAWLAGAAPATATLLVYEPFAYDDGTVLAGSAATGHNLTGIWTAGGGATAAEISAASPGLDYGNLTNVPTASGNRATQTIGTAAASATAGLAQPVAIGAGDTLYWSALITFDDSSNANRLAYVEFHDDDTGESLLFGETAAGVRNVRVGASTAALGGFVATGDYQFTDGQTLLLIGRYVNAADPDADSLALIGFDVSNPTPLPPTFDLANPAATLAFELSGVTIDLAQITSLALTIRGDANNFIDEIRIGDSYASVVPEPASVLLLGIGLAGLVTFGRRRPRT